MSTRQKLSALAAMDKTMAHFEVKRSKSHELFAGEKADEAKAYLLQQIEELSQLRPRHALNQTKADVVPLAVEEMHASNLDQEHRTALVRGLNMFNRPLQIVAGMDPATFRDALDKLKQDYPEFDSDKHYRDWHERSAVILATVFKGNWQNWLAAQNKLGRDAFEATTWLMARPPSESKGLGVFLLENSNRNIKHLEKISDNWREVKEIESRKFNDVLHAALLEGYDKIEDQAFAREASLWGVKPEDYPEMEKRYMASTDTPSPFPLEMRWKEQGLTGRFLPRNDPRGLFVGEHTNCCQHPGGNAESSAWYGQENPKSGFFVVENANKEIIAQSWTMVTDSGGVIFDNVEAKGLGKQHDAVLSIYKDVAKSLVAKHPLVTMGMGNSDLETDTLPRAKGLIEQTLPADFSGYSDAGQQVILASNGQIPPEPPEKTIVRGALSFDKPAMLRIAQENFPEGWRHIPWEASTRGLVVQDSRGRVQGYALYEPQNRYVADLAVRKDTKANYGYMLTSQLVKAMRNAGGQWTADMRESTSYRAVKKASDLGRIKIITDEVTDSPMGMEPMHHVVMEFPSTNKDAANEALNIDNETTEVSTK